jgi:hypothetical protein
VWKKRRMKEKRRSGERVPLVRIQAVVRSANEREL